MCSDYNLLVFDLLGGPLETVCGCEEFSVSDSTALFKHHKCHIDRRKIGWNWAFLTKKPIEIVMC